MIRYNKCISIMYRYIFLPCSVEVFNLGSLKLLEAITASNYYLLTESGKISVKSLIFIKNRILIYYKENKKFIYNQRHSIETKN